MCVDRRQRFFAPLLTICTHQFLNPEFAKESEVGFDIATQ